MSASDDLLALRGEEIRLTATLETLQSRRASFHGQIKALESSIALSRQRLSALKQNLLAIKAAPVVSIMRCRETLDEHQDRRDTLQGLEQELFAVRTECLNNETSFQLRESELCNNLDKQNEYGLIIPFRRTNSR